MAKTSDLLPRPSNPRQGPGEAYRTLFDWLRRGEYTAGERLPSERRLAGLFRLNHQTIRRALSRLENEGYIENRPRIGRFVRDVNSGQMVHQITLVLPTYMGNNHPTASAWLRGMHNVFESGKYVINTLFFRPSLFDFDVVEILLRRRVTGIIFLDNGITPQGMQRLIDSGIHAIQIGSCSAELSAMALPAFKLSEVQATNAILAGLVERGHRSITIFRYSADYDQAEVNHAIERASRLFGGVAEFRAVVLHNEGGVTDFSPIRESLSPGASFDAVVVPDEFVAREVFRYAYQNNWRIPDRFSMVSVVNNAADLYPIAMAHAIGFDESVRMLEAASRSMIARISGQTVYSNQVSMSCQVKWSESVRQPQP